MMKWYYTIAGGHTHARVFMNGAKCGDLCFRNDEFLKVQRDLAGRAQFIDETHKKPTDRTKEKTNQ